MIRYESDHMRIKIIKSLYLDLGKKICTLWLYALKACSFKISQHFSWNQNFTYKQTYLSTTSMYLFSIVHVKHYVFLFYKDAN